MCWFLQSRPSVLVCRNNISIHQMCWFLLSTIAAVRFVSHFNTSNVLVSQSVEQAVDLVRRNFNTSNVLVSQSYSGYRYNLC